jgi:hypothetical protein
LSVGVLGGLTSEDLRILLLQFLNHLAAMLGF